MCRYSESKGVGHDIGGQATQASVAIGRRYRSPGRNRFAATIQSGVLAPKFDAVGDGTGGDAPWTDYFNDYQNASWRSWTITGSVWWTTARYALEPASTSSMSVCVVAATIKDPPYNVSTVRPGRDSRSIWSCRGRLRLAEGVSNECSGAAAVPVVTYRTRTEPSHRHRRHNAIRHANGWNHISRSVVRASDGMVDF